MKADTIRLTRKGRECLEDRSWSRSTMLTWVARVRPTSSPAPPIRWVPAVCERSAKDALPSSPTRAAIPACISAIVGCVSMRPEWTKRMNPTASATRPSTSFVQPRSESVCSQLSPLVSGTVR